MSGGRSIRCWFIRWMFRLVTTSSTLIKAGLRAAACGGRPRPAAPTAAPILTQSDSTEAPEGAL
jgi:hypothetical protein